MTNTSDLPSRPRLNRRAALAKLGLAATAAYVAPAVLALSDARASSHPSRARAYPSHACRRHRRVYWRRHPRHGYWIGRRFPFHHRHYVVIVDYDRYYLPPPRRGHFYVRVDDDVFLVAEASKRIIDAFVLLHAAAR